VLEARQQALHDAHGALQVGIEKHDRETPFRGLREQIGLAQLTADETSDQPDQGLAVVLTADGSVREGRLEEQQGEKVQRTDRAFQFVVQDELKRSGRQQKVVFHEGVTDHHDPLVCSIWSLGERGNYT
jgi:hypothetical protein